MRYILSFIILLVLISCSRADFAQKINLKSVHTPASIKVEEEAKLRDYATKINTIDIDKTLAQLQSKKEKKEFKYRIAELKTAYNKCVDKLDEADKTSFKDKKIRELKECMFQFAAIWNYILSNYKL